MVKIHLFNACTESFSSQSLSQPTPQQAKVRRLHQPLACAMELESRDFRAMMFLHYMQKKSPTESHQTLQEVFGDPCPSYATVKNWFAEFRRGRESLQDEHRSGRPPEAVTVENINAVRSLIQADRRVTYEQIQQEVGIGSGSVHIILHQHLGVRKLACRWIPHKLTDEQKETRVAWCRFMLQKFDAGGSRRIWDILTGDET